MKSLKHLLVKAFFPGGMWPVLAVPLIIVSLFVAFATPLHETGFAYLLYLTAAYGLAVLVIGIFTSLIPAVNSFMDTHPLTVRYRKNICLRVRIALLVSFLMGICYAIFKLIYAVRFISFWEGALAFYYVLLSISRIYLLHKIPETVEQSNYKEELRVYRFTGLFMIALNIALTAIAFQIIQAGYDYEYPGHLIFAAAAVTFYFLVLAIVGTVQFRKYKSPVLSATKAINLITAFVSLFSLESAMIMRFGGSYEFRQIMTTITGSAVCLAALVIAIYMVSRANSELRKLGRREKNNDSNSCVGR